MVEMTRERLAKESVMFIPLRFGASVMFRPPDALHFPTWGRQNSECFQVFVDWEASAGPYTYQEIKMKLRNNCLTKKTMIALSEL